MVRSWGLDGGGQEGGGGGISPPRETNVHKKARGIGLNRVE